MEKNVDKDMLIGDLLEAHQGVAAVLFRAGMHCVGCPSSAGETLEEAGMIHGLDVDEIVDEINGLIAKK